MHWQGKYPDPPTAVYEETRRRRDLAVPAVCAAALVLPIVGGLLLEHLAVGGAGPDSLSWTGFGPGVAIVALVASFVWAWRRMGFGALPYGAWTVIPVVLAFAVGLLADPWVAGSRAAEAAQRWCMAVAFVFLGVRLAPVELMAVVFRSDLRPGPRVFAAVLAGGWVVAGAGMVSHAARWPSEWAHWQLVAVGAAALLVGRVGLHLVTRHDPDWHVPVEPDWREGLPASSVEPITRLKQRSDRVILVGGLLFIVVGLGGFAASYSLELADSVGLIVLAVGCAAGLAGMIYAVVLDEQVRTIVTTHESASEDVGEQNHADTR